MAGSDDNTGLQLLFSFGAADAFGDVVVVAAAAPAVGSWQDDDDDNNVGVDVVAGVVHAEYAEDETEEDDADVLDDDVEEGAAAVDKGITSHSILLAAGRWPGRCSVVLCFATQTTATP